MVSGDRWGLLIPSGALGLRFELVGCEPGHQSQSLALELTHGCVDGPTIEAAD